MDSPPPPPHTHTHTHTCAYSLTFSLPLVSSPAWDGIKQLPDPCQQYAMDLATRHSVEVSCQFWQTRQLQYITSKWFDNMYGHLIVVLDPRMHRLLTCASRVPYRTTSCTIALRC